VYANTSLDLALASGATKNLVIRADSTTVASTSATYAASIASVSGGDLVIYETDSNTSITDITPNALTFNAVTIQAPAITFSANPLSASYNAVIGSSNVQVLNFNMKANDTDALKVTELQITDEDSGTEVSSRIISRIRLYKDGEATPVSDISGSKIASEVVTFDNLTLNIPKGETVKYYATIDLVSDNAEAGSSTKWGLTAYTAEDVTEGEAVTDSAFSSGMDSGRTVEIKASGSLIVEMDNTNSDTLKDRYEIAGNTSGLLAAIKLRATNENITLEDLAVAIYKGVDASAYTAANTMWSELQLIDSDKSTVLKSISSISASTTFEDVNIAVPMTSKTIYIKGVLKSLGKDQVGDFDASSTFAISDVVAKGAESAVNLTTNASTSAASVACAAGSICYVRTTATGPAMTTNKSKETAMIASKISSVDLVSAGGGCTISSSLSSGWNTVAVIKVTTDNNNNSLLTGDEVKTVLDTITVDFAETGATTTYTTIEKCGGTGAALNESGASTTAIAFPLSSWATDDEIAKSGTAYYAVKFYISEISGTAGAASVQVDLNNLDAITSAANFKWYDTTDASFKYPLRLSSNKVTGTKISN
jgi:hypothetical protein